MITHLRLTIEKLKREIYGPRNERKARLIEQMELELEELEAAAAEDKLMAEKANENNTTAVRAFTRNKPSRKPFPAHLPRERVIVPGPSAASSAGSAQNTFFNKRFCANNGAAPARLNSVPKTMMRVCQSSCLREGRNVQEFSGCRRLRGGADRTRTSNQFPHEDL